MSAKEPENSHTPIADIGYERHDVSIPYIVGFAVICLGAIIAGIVMVDGFFTYTKEQMIHEANKIEPRALMELRAQEEERLSTYDVIDKEKGVYRIPISRAMTLVNEESFESSKK